MQLLLYFLKDKLVRMNAIYIQILKVVLIQIELDLDIFDCYLGQINLF